MILKHYWIFTTFVFVLARENSPVQLIRYGYVHARKAPDNKQAYSDVVQNISQVNDILEDLIDNYQKLKSLYKSREAISEDFSSDGEMDEVYKQRAKNKKKQKGNEENLETTTKGPFEPATEMFFSEEKLHSDGGDYNDTDNNSNENDKNEKDKDIPQIKSNAPMVTSIYDTTKIQKEEKVLENNSFNEKSKVVDTGGPYQISKTNPTIPKRYKKVTNKAMETPVHKKTTKQVQTEFIQQPYANVPSSDHSESQERNKDTQTVQTKQVYKAAETYSERFDKTKTEQYDEANSGSQELGLKIPELSYENRDVELDYKNVRNYDNIQNERNKEPIHESQESSKEIRYNTKQKISSPKRENKIRKTTAKNIRYENKAKQEVIYESQEPMKEIKHVTNKKNVFPDRTENKKERDTKLIKNVDQIKDLLPKEIAKEMKIRESSKGNGEPNTDEVGYSNENQPISQNVNNNSNKAKKNKVYKEESNHNLVSKKEVNKNYDENESSDLTQGVNEDSNKTKKNKVYKEENNYNLVSKKEVNKNYDENESSDLTQGVNEDQIRSIIGPQTRFKIETRPVLVTETYYIPKQKVIKKDVIVASETRPEPSYDEKFKMPTPAIIKKTANPIRANRYVKKVVQAEDFSKNNIWDEIIHKPINLHTEKEVVYKQPRIFFRDQLFDDNLTFRNNADGMLETDVQTFEINNRSEDQEEIGSHLNYGSSAQSADKMSRRTKKKIGKSSIESGDDHKLMKEQLQTRILRKAYGDACLKVVVRKCWKACKSAFQDTCKKYNCNTHFKQNFLGNAKTACIQEFRQGDDVHAAVHRNGESLVNTHFQDLTRNGYLAAVCLPIAREANLLRSNMSVHEFGPVMKMNILRDRFEKACQKASAEKCENACDRAAITTCETLDCQGHKLAYLKKQCRRDCKAYYRGKKRPSVKDTSSSDSGSRSRSRKKRKDRKKYKKSKRSSSSSSGSSSSSSKSSSSSESGMGWSDFDAPKHKLNEKQKANETKHKSGEKKHKSEEKKHKSEEKKHKSNEKKHKSEEHKHKSEEKKHKSEEKKHKSEEKKHKSEEKKHKSEEKKHKSDEKKHKSDEHKHSVRKNKHRILDLEETKTIRDIKAYKMKKQHQH